MTTKTKTQGTTQATQGEKTGAGVPWPGRQGQRMFLESTLGALERAGWAFTFNVSDRADLSIGLTSPTGKTGTLRLLMARKGDEAAAMPGQAHPILEEGQVLFVARIRGTGDRPLRDADAPLGVNWYGTSPRTFVWWLGMVDEDHPVVQPHRQVRVEAGGKVADVDELVAPFIERLWRAGLPTLYSCQFASRGKFPMYINPGPGGDVGAMVRALGLQRGEYAVRNGVLWLPLPDKHAKPAKPPHVKKKAIPRLVDDATHHRACAALYRSACREGGGEGFQQPGRAYTVWVDDRTLELANCKGKLGRVRVMRDGRMTAL